MERMHSSEGQNTEQFRRNSPEYEQHYDNAEYEESTPPKQTLSREEYQKIGHQTIESAKLQEEAESEEQEEGMSY